MCIIVFKKIDNKNYIAKNRDKSISTTISIIHEIVDNIEIVYMYDVNTYWVEGMNEFNIKELAYNEIIKVNNKNEILKSLNKNYIDLHPEFHTYLNKKQTLAYLDTDDRYLAFNTTSQTLMCLSELLFYFNYDQDNCYFVKYDNRLPINYVPKIKVFINKISKCKNPEKMPFNPTHIEKIIETHMYKKKNILFYCVILLLLLIIYIHFFN